MSGVLDEVLGRGALPEVELGFHGADGAPWRVVHVAHREGLSELFECSVVVTAEDTGQRPDGLLGAEARVSIARGGDERVIHGVVRRVEDLGSSATHTYARVVVAPALWTLTHRKDSRIFQHLNVAAIVREVLRDAGVYQGPGALVIPPSVDAHPAREYCVQYQESDLDFVLRLLQEESVPFRFEHGEREGLVLVGDGEAWPELARPTVAVTDGAMHHEAVETVRWFDPRGEVRPTDTTLRDYDFTRPSATLEMTPASSPQRGPRAIFEYPARVNLHSYGGDTYGGHDGARQARVRHEADVVPQKAARGAGNVTAFTPGRSFALLGHMRPDVDARYVLTRVEHVASAWSDLPEDVRESESIQAQLRDAGVHLPEPGRRVEQRYHNRFDVLPASVPFHPARTVPRPIIPSIQTARVVGPGGEEIYVDVHGRIKVQFHWDRVGANDERSSCWIRCMQLWGGGGWGFQFIPRIGMEVVVQFAEGDPDRPIVTGSLYNGENRYANPMPEHKTRSGVRTNSTPTSGGYNELRFEDKAGEEQVYVQAERNHDTLVKNDQTVTVRRHRTKLVDGNESNTIVSNRTTTVHENESKDVGGNRDEQVRGPYGSSLTVDHNYKLQAGDSITFETGDSKIFMKPGEIFISSATVRIHAPKLVEIKGGLVKINCPDAAPAPSPPSPPDPVQVAMQAGMRGAAAALGAAAGGLGGALQGAIGAALGPVLSAVMGGAGGGAPAALMQGAMGALGQAVERIAGASPVGGAAQAMLPQAERSLGAGVEAAHGLNAALADNPQWQELSRTQPEVASATLRRATSPLVRRGLVRAEVPAGSEREFDGVAGATMQAHRGAIDGMVTGRGGAAE